MTVVKKKKKGEFDVVGLEDGRSGAQMKEYGQPLEI